jgi:hypothetical protein
MLLELIEEREKLIRQRLGRFHIVQDKSLALASAA